MDHEGPLVSILVPAFNEATHITETLASISAQSYRNIEIIVCDNASTDGTFEVLQRWGVGRSNYIVRRNRENLGALANFQLALGLARGDFFMFVGGHDMVAPGFVAAAVRRMVGDPRVSFVYGKHAIVGADGGIRDARWVSQIGTDVGASLVARCLRFFDGISDCACFHGLYRMSLRRGFPLVDCMGTDNLVLFHAAVCGDIVYLDGIGYYRRENRWLESWQERLARYRSFGLSTNGEYYSLLHRFMDYLESRGVATRLEDKIVLRQKMLEWGLTLSRSGRRAYIARMAKYALGKGYWLSFLSVILFSCFRIAEDWFPRSRRGRR